MLEKNCMWITLSQLFIINTKDNFCLSFLLLRLFSLEKNKKTNKKKNIVPP